MFTAAGYPNLFIASNFAKDLHMHTYEIQLMQNLKPADHGKQRQFADWVLEKLAADNNFAKQIIFSDDVHFHLSGFFTKQNCWIWVNEYSQIMQEREMHPLRTVWRGFWKGGVIRRGDCNCC